MSKRKLTVDDQYEVPECKYIFRFNILIPSLQHLSNVNIATALWSSDGIRGFIKRFITSEPKITHWSKAWSRAIERVVDEIKLLHFPVKCRNELNKVVEAMGIELRNWISYHDENIFEFFGPIEYSSKAYKFVDQIVWTNRGTIDYGKTARRFIDHESLTTRERYLTACLYCFRDKIDEFDEHLVTFEFLIAAEKRNNKFVYYWSSLILNGELKNFSTEYRAPSSYEAVAKFINESRKTWMTHPSVTFGVVENATKSPSPSARKRIRRHIEFSPWNMPLHTLLSSLIDSYLWTEYFLPTVYANRDVISSGTFCSAVNALTKKIANSEDDLMYNKYVSIFEGLMTCTPDKQCFCNSMSNIFLALRWDKHLHVIRSLYATYSSSQKRMFLQAHGVNLCTKFLERNNLQHVKTFIDMSCETEAEIKEFKKLYVAQKGSEIIVLHVKIKNIPQLSEFLRWIFETEDGVRRFKNSMHHKALPTVAHHMIFAHISKVRPVIDTELLDSYLMWHRDFKIDQVKRLKVTLVENMLCGKINKMVVKQAPRCVRQIVDYLFENNEEERDRFKKEKINHAIYQFF